MCFNRSGAKISFGFISRPFLVSTVSEVGDALADSITAKAAAASTDLTLRTTVPDMVKAHDQAIAAAAANTDHLLAATPPMDKLILEAAQAREAEATTVLTAGEKAATAATTTTTTESPEEEEISVGKAPIIGKTHAVCSTNY